MGAAGPVGPASRVPAFLAKLSCLSEGHEGLCAGTSLEQERHFMPLYEHVFLARQDLSPQQVEEMTTQFKGIIEGLGGKVEKSEYWGVKTLTFRIAKNRKAHFTLFNLDAPPAAITEVERQERIHEDVLRTLTVRVEELEEGPSAMMRKVDRDRERDDRRGGFDRGDRGFDRERPRQRTEEAATEE
jgi:small subunit ribosomal protein S6